MDSVFILRNKLKEVGYNIATAHHPKDLIGEAPSTIFVLNREELAHLINTAVGQKDDIVALRELELTRLRNRISEMAKEIQGLREPTPPSKSYGVSFLSNLPEVNKVFAGNYTIGVEKDGSIEVTREFK